MACDDANIDQEATDPGDPDDPVVTSGLIISDGPVYNFGTVNVGNTTTHTFTVTNTGSGTALSMMGSGLAAPYDFLGGAYPGTGGTCAVTLAAAATCTIVVAYSPSMTGVQSDTITINYNDGSSAQTANRDTTGTAIP